MSASLSIHAGAAFDALADRYDELFTNSLVGRAQREAVLRVADRVFQPGMHLLELNCGTGEDARHFARRSMRVTACDASPRMIEVCRRRSANDSHAARLDFRTLPTERIAEAGERFDGVFSNFSGLNCVRDLHAVAAVLAGMVPAGAPLLLCFSTRFCAWELGWFAARAEFVRATRRWGGSATPAVAGNPVDVWYPTVRKLRRRFTPWFELQHVHGVGVAIPPSYAEEWVRFHPRTFAALSAADAAVRDLPLLRALGDHVLLQFRRIR